MKRSIPLVPLIPLWCVLLFGACGMPEPKIDQDADGVLAALDCDDKDPSVGLGGDETCDDGEDQDCDGHIDEGCETAPEETEPEGSIPPTVTPTPAPELDLDGDGHLPEDKGGGDCDDEDPDIHPGAAEVCDGDDQDCDGEIDEGADVAFFVDDDGDGYGVATTGCDPPVREPAPGDCDDGDREVNPAADEICDGVDNNCDGVVDYGPAPGPVPVGSLCETQVGVCAGATRTADLCQGEAGWSACPDSIYASQAAVTGEVFHPDDDRCDGVDNDCDGEADEGGDVYFPDDDGDGFGDESRAETLCGTPAQGYVLAGGDCDDGNALSFPGADEACDGADNDCDGIADEAQGLAEAPAVACELMGGVCEGAVKGAALCVEGAWQPCDDNDYAAHDSAYSAADPADGLDNNCDGFVDEDDPPVGTIVISEVQPNPVGPESYEFIELFNTSDMPVDVHNWRIYGPNFSFPVATSPYVLQGGEFMVFARTRFEGVANSVLTSPENPWVLPDDEGELYLTGYSAEVGETQKDTFIYDVSLFVGYEEGRSIALDPEASGEHPGAERANQCLSSTLFLNTGTGTPGAANDTCDHDFDDDGADARLAGGDDCDDSDPSISPAAVEVADDGVDNNCDDRLLLSEASFVMGSDENDPDTRGDEWPERVVTPGAFAMGRAEVSARQYAACVADGVCIAPTAEGCETPGSLLASEHLTFEVYPDHPVNCVTHAMAQAYCGWAGGRLPTEAEWERAARGSCAELGEVCAVDDAGVAGEADEPTYPWGEAPPNCNLANAFDGDYCQVSGEAPLTYPATALPDGASPAGALNMGGNVYEWVEDCYVPGYDEAPVDGSAVVSGCIDQDQVLRGGSFFSEPQSLRVSSRFPLDGGVAHIGVGFRCAFEPSQ